MTVVLGGERSVELPEASVDLAFVCDTYHHFEYPRSTLASLHTAIRPGGALVVVDFEREPGQLARLGARARARRQGASSLARSRRPASRSSARSP